MSLHFWPDRCPKVGHVLFPPEKAADGLGVYAGQRDGEAAQDRVISHSVSDLLVLAFDGRDQLAGR